MTGKQNDDSVREFCRSDSRQGATQYAHVWRVVGLRNVLWLVLLLSLGLSSSCNPSAVTVFQATFNNDTIGSPPAVNQDVGTLTFNAGAGRIKVVNTPVAGITSTKWVQITEDALRCDFARVDGPGNYGFLGSIVIPHTTTGIVSLAFQPDFDQQVEFMHLDFMPEGDVRIDDGARFGQYPKDGNFTVNVKLSITNANATAEITLFGTGASGHTTANVNQQLMLPARRFGAIKFFMGDQQHGTFFVKDIIVTRT